MLEHRLNSHYNNDKNHISKYIASYHTSSCIDYSFNIRTNIVIRTGMAYEAMNNAAYINSKVIVILNDNGQVSLPTGQPSAGILNIE